MSCEWYQDELMELARSRDTSLSQKPLLAAHLRQCDECAQYFRRQQGLQVSLEALIADTDTVKMSEAVEARVLAEFDAASISRALPRRWWVVATPATAIGIVLAVLLIHRAPPISKNNTVSSDAVEQPFLAIPYVIPPAPYERTEVVRMEVPLSTLAAEGFEVHVPDMGGSVTADVLCGQDGRALAIRFLKDANPDFGGRNSL